MTDTGVAPALGSGYLELEHVVAGAAATYSGPAIGPVLAEPRNITYATRVLVRFPNDPARFSGRVVLEPFNTSSGPDADVIWRMTGQLLESNGDAWIGVSARASSALALQAFDPRRYADLDFLANDLAWDVLRQVGTLARSADGLLPGLAVKSIYLAGYSQSGADVATFAMCFHNSARLADGSPVFDGYLPAAHSGSLSPLQSGALTLPAFECAPMRPVPVPVVGVESQSDVEGFAVGLASGVEYTSPGGASVRRNDSDEPGDLYRLYEIAGAPHVTSRAQCKGGGSNLSIDPFIRAGLIRLYRWAEEGAAPPRAARIELEIHDRVSRAAVDACGNAVGGVRSPYLDVPLARYAVHSEPGPLCQLVGCETVLSRDVLTARYGDVDRYLAEFSRCLDTTISAGFLLARDRELILTEHEATARVAFGT